MKKDWMRSWMVFLLCCTGAWTANSNATTPEAAPIKILCFGDSITAGGASFSSYPPILRSRLTLLGYSTEFVGSQTLETPEGPLHHEGHGGWNAQRLAGIAEEVIRKFPADVILIHAGHNAFADQNPVAGLVDSVEDMVRVFSKARPDAWILVAQVIPSGKLPKYGYLTEFNQALTLRMEKLRTEGFKIRVVDQSHGFDWQKDAIADKVHPNPQGAAKMAGRWEKALTDLLGEPGK